MSNQNENKKIFGLVSKIGSLMKKNPATKDEIQSESKNDDNSPTNEKQNKESDDKNFNIEIKNEDQDYYNLNDDDDDDDDDNEDNDDEEKEEKENEEKEKSEESEKIEEEEKEDENEETNNENKKDEPKINNEKKEEEIKINNSSKNEITNNEKNENNENKEKKENKEIDESKNDDNGLKTKKIISDKTCHVLAKKGSDVDITEYEFFLITKNKKTKNNFIQKFNFFSKKKDNSFNYYLLINENFAYFCKNIAIVQNNINKRRIGSIVPLFFIKTVFLRKEENNYRMKFDIKYRHNLRKCKEFLIDSKNYVKLMETINQKIKLYNLNINITSYR